MSVAAIIAAGDGLRLRAAHPSQVKPLISVAGAPLAHWVVGSLRKAGVNAITVLTNSRGQELPVSLRAAFPDITWSFLERNTASSWESFRLVCQALTAKGSDHFLISTVDALIPPDQVRIFTQAMAASRSQAGLALTEFVDDEKPLWADLDAHGRVTALGPDARTKKTLTTGLYYMTEKLACAMPDACAHDSLRSYWRELVSAGVPVAGVVLSQTLDVDRPQDILVAEGFLKASQPWLSV